MINAIMDYCNNHFWRSREASIYTIVSDGITGTFSNTYIVGQYIHIANSFLNDGVYKVASVTSNKITVEETLIEEDTGEYIVLYGCAVPKAFLTLVTDITSWQLSNAGKEGLASETIDSYSISFASGSNGTTGSSWQNAFSTQLQTYMQMFESWC